MENEVVGLSLFDSAVRRCVYLATVYAKSLFIKALVLVLRFCIVVSF